MRAAQRILTALALLSAPTAAQWTVDADLPKSGHVWAVGPLPVSAPDVLVGPHGVRAYRLETLGEQCAIYGLETFAEFVDGPIELEPGTDADGIALWWAHPAVLDDPAAVAGRVSIDGQPSKGAQWTIVQDGEHRKRFRAVHDTGAHWAVLWCDVFARSPVVHVAGFVARKDRQLQRDVELSLEFGEQLAFPWERLHGGRLRLEDGGIRGSIDLERGGVYPLRFSLLCRRQPGVIGPPVAGDAPLDDLDELAIEAGKRGQRWFVPLEWPGEWLGVDLTGRPQAGADLAQGALEAFREPHRMTDLRPWASMPGASQGGSQPSLGLTWFAPALVPAELRPADVHLWSAEDWALRPMHLLEPGTSNPVAKLHRFGATVASRQVYGIERIGRQVVPMFQTRGGLDVHLPSGNVDQRMPPDELHTADGPLIAAYALTGDPLCRWLLDSVRELDLAQRQVSSGWRSNGRGEGRTVSSMLLAARTMRADVRAEVVEHCLLRLETAIASADTASLPSDAISRPIELYTDNRLRCQHPALIPYEEAQGAYGWWLLYQDSGDARALRAAYRFGLTVAATLYQDGDAWRVPYACTQLEDGQPLTDKQLRDPVTAHPSTFPILWSGCGLRALVNAAAELDVPEEHAPFVDRARAALAWIDGRELGHVEEIHQALHRARYAPRPVR